MVDVKFGIFIVILKLLCRREFQCDVITYVCDCLGNKLLFVAKCLKSYSARRVIVH